MTKLTAPGEDLQRGQSAQPLVAGAEDHREPARPDLGLQPVPGQQRARPEPGQRREILAQHPSPPPPRSPLFSVVTANALLRQSQYVADLLLPQHKGGGPRPGRYVPFSIMLGCFCQRRSARA